MVEEPARRRRSDIEPADQTTVNWEEMAAWWAERHGDEGDLWHRTLIDPTLFKVLGPAERHDVLDLACGNGYVVSFQ